MIISVAFCGRVSIRIRVAEEVLVRDAGGRHRQLIEQRVMNLFEVRLAIGAEKQTRGPIQR